ncbi:glycoside hydrolase family 88 protein [Gaoshiqia sp. Z1-71]|uniref:glycoside hydrolase family 88 protein n=1 Tax=Gaoshiqia hydrogeniformans TaxID=3290090 RepID=UPI003BF7A02E
MKNRHTFFFLLSIFIALTACTPKPESMQDVINRSMAVAAKHLVAMDQTLAAQEGKLPRSINPQTGELITSNSRWWCSGFYPGSLWYLYEFNQDESLKTLAEKYTAIIEKEKYTTTTHDLGFMLYCSFGNGLRQTSQPAYEEVLVTGSESLCTRYHSTVGLIKSWDHNNDKWQFPVIIDNMMNLEMLMWTFKHTGDSAFYNISVSHADKTMENHYRPDYSCYHVVSYDTITGMPHIKQTHQGAADESIWARGQAWGLYGYVMMYRETGHQRYLDMANQIADLMISHPNLPPDKIPYWDYLAPEIPNEERDASAAAIMASALIELSGYVDQNRKEQYLSVAETQLRTLASPEYLAEPGTNGNFILKHSVGHKPGKSEVDVPLTYADYYFLEALLRFQKII